MSPLAEIGLSEAISALFGAVVVGLWRIGRHGWNPLNLASYDFRWLYAVPLLFLAGVLAGYLLEFLTLPLSFFAPSIDRAGDIQMAALLGGFLAAIILFSGKAIASGRPGALLLAVLGELVLAGICLMVGFKTIDAFEPPMWRSFVFVGGFVAAGVLLAGAAFTRGIVFRQPPRVRLPSADAGPAS